MCDMKIVAMGAEGAATIMQGVAAKKRGDAERDAAYLSADASERAAADAIERGKLKDLQVAMHGSSVVADQRVAQGATGADVNIGAPKATQDATQAVSDVDRAVVTRNAALEAYGLAQRARGQRQHGQNAEAAGKAAMLGTFLGGIGKLGSQGAALGSDYKSSSDDSGTFEGG